MRVARTRFGGAQGGEGIAALFLSGLRVRENEKGQFPPRVLFRRFSRSGRAPFLQTRMWDKGSNGAEGVFVRLFHYAWRRDCARRREPGAMPHEALFVQVVLQRADLTEGGKRSP